MKPFFLSLLGLSLSITLQANDYENAEKELVERNKSALSKLAETRTKIQNEKIPLATKLSALERSVEEKRRSLDRLQRLRDNKSVSLTALKKEVDGRKTEAQFLSTLGSDYLANFEARLHVAEIDRNQAELSQIKSVLDSDSSEKEKMTARMNLLTMSIKRIEELLGGTQFDGQALDGSGKVREGTFVLSGPLAYFNEKSGTLAGLTESGRDLKPRIFELQDPQASTLRSYFKSDDGSVATLPVDATLGDAVKVAAAEDNTPKNYRQAFPSNDEERNDFLLPSGI